MDGKGIAAGEAASTGAVAPFPREHGLARGHLLPGLVAGLIFHGLWCWLVWSMGADRTAGAWRYIYTLQFERSPITHLEMGAFWVGIGLLLARIRPLVLDWQVLKSVSEALSADRAAGGRSPAPALAVFSNQPRPTLTSSLSMRLVERATTAAEPAELDAFIDQISDLERRKVEASQEPIRYLIYLIPTLGFTGTVLGISEAVMGFSNVVGTSADAATLQRTLIQICTSLGVSFDTTLIALILSAIIALVKASIDRGEMMLASAVDETAISQLRPVLDVSPINRVRQIGDVSASDAAGHDMVATNGVNGYPGGAAGTGGTVIVVRNEDGTVGNLRELAELAVARTLAGVAEGPRGNAEAVSAPANGMGAHGHSGPDLRSLEMLQLLEAKVVLSEQVARHLQDVAARREDVAALREAVLRVSDEIATVGAGQLAALEALGHLVQELRNERAARTEVDRRLAEVLELLQRDGVSAKVRLSLQPDGA